MRIRRHDRLRILRLTLALDSKRGALANSFHGEGLELVDLTRELDLDRGPPGFRYHH